MAIDYEHALFWKDRTLQLLLAIDQIRDSYEDDEDQQGMFSTLVKLMREQFRADACSIALISETSEEIETLAADGMTEDQARTLCLEASRRSGSAPVTTTDWPHTLAIQIILKHFPLGGLVLARSSEAFTVEEVGLLTFAESQIDSAIVQARTVWKLIERNRELEAIYQIDRLRDQLHREPDLIAGFTTLLLERFGSELCLLLLTDRSSGELVVRGVVNNPAISASALDDIRVSASGLQIPQVIPAPENFPHPCLLAAPLIVLGERLGAVVVGRDMPYTVGDHRLLYAMMSQMDTAIAHSRKLERS